MERLRPYLRWRNINILLALALIVALGVVFGPIAATGPKILEVTPSDGAADANPQAGLQIVFSQWVQPGSVERAVKFDPPIEFTVVEPGFPRAGASTVLIQPKAGL